MRVSVVVLAHVGDVLQVIRDADWDDVSTTAWFGSRQGSTNGDVPALLIRDDPARLLAAARISAADTCATSLPRPDVLHVSGSCADTGPMVTDYRFRRMALVGGFARTLRWLARSHEGRNFGLIMLAFAIVMAAVGYWLRVGSWYIGPVLGLSAGFGTAWQMARDHERRRKHHPAVRRFVRASDE